MKPIKQSAVIPYRHMDGELEIALITSRNTKRWIVPKGGVEGNMTPWASAAKEALEEAGLLGTVGEKELGEYFYTKFDKLYRVSIYPLRATKTLETWDEMEFRKRTWVSCSDAIQRIKEPAVKQAIKKLSKLKKWPDNLP